jgi:hypothetical protein
LWPTSEENLDVSGSEPDDDLQNQEELMTTQYIIKNDNGTFYYKDKEMNIPHREDGPAIEWANGHKLWFLNGLLHREDGPAIEWANGTKYWYLNGQSHREDGPAVERADGYKAWFLNDKEVSEAKHKKLTRKEPTITIEGKAFTVAQLKNLIKQATI